MRKKALLAALMAMILLLSGCALVVKDEAVDNATEIIRMGDQVITKDKVKAQVENQLYYMANQYAMYGYNIDTTDPDVIAQAQSAAVEALKNDLALTAKAKELGLDQLTDEEKETVANNAKETYDIWANYVKPSDTEGMDEEAIAKACEDNLKELGITMDSITESETKTVLESKLKEYAIKDVTVTEEEIKDSYDTLVERDKGTYEGKAGSWATAANNGTTLYYTPAGIRRVKQILTKFKDEDKTAIDEANKQVTSANTARTTAQNKIDAAQETLDAEGATEEDKAKAQEDLDAAKQELDEADKALAAASAAVQEATDKAFANIDADTDAILAQLAEGADWQALMDEKNQDPGMKDNEKGYAVAADMTGFDSAFVEAAMALEKPGDYSGKVKGSSYGYYIIRYEGDEAEGATALEAVKDTISADVLSDKQSETYDEMITKWVEEAGIKVDMNALKD